MMKAATMKARKNGVLAGYLVGAAVTNADPERIAQVLCELGDGPGHPGGDYWYLPECVTAALTGHELARIGMRAVFGQYKQLPFSLDYSGTLFAAVLYNYVYEIEEVPIRAAGDVLGFICDDPMFEYTKVHDYPEVMEVIDSVTRKAEGFDDARKRLSDFPARYLLIGLMLAGAYFGSDAVSTSEVGRQEVPSSLDHPEVIRLLAPARVELALSKNRYGEVPA